MHRLRNRLTAVALAAALAVPLIGMKPAEAVPTPSGCKATTTAGAELGHYPANPASQSGLRVACVLSNNPGSAQIPARYSVHDFPNAVYHNGAARTITTAAAVGAGAPSVTASNCTAITGYVNRGISGTGIAPRAFATSISGGCVITLSNPTTAAIPAGTALRLDNGIGRSRVDATTTNASTTLTSPTFNFTLADNGLSVTGTNIPANTTATFVNATTITLSNPATATEVGTATITLGGTLENTTTRTARSDAGSINAGTNVLTSTVPRFTADDVGLPVIVTGGGAAIMAPSGVGTGPVIGTVTNATTVTLVCAGCADPVPGAVNFTASAATPLIAQIGDPSVTAPVSADTIANQGVQLDLSPTLVAGTEACANEDPEGFSTVARWNNPGSFAGSVAFNTQPANTKAIGQIYFDTAVTDFSAFVVERRGGAFGAGEPHLAGTVHYDIMFPSLPVTLAQCAGTATSPGLGFSLGVHAQTKSVAVLASGTGKPGTAQFRSLRSEPTGTYAANIYVVSDDPAVTFSPAGEFTRFCNYGFAPAEVNMVCGNG